MSSEELHPVPATEAADFGDEAQDDAGLCAVMASAAQSMDNAGAFNILSGWPAVSILCNEPLFPVCNTSPMKPCCWS